MAFLFAISTAQLSAQKLNPNWSTDLNTLLTEFKKCQKNACRDYLAKSIKAVYPTVDETFVSEETKQPLRGNALITYMKETGRWLELGKAADQANLDKAAQYAKEGKAVIAIVQNKDGGAHVSLIIPGGMTASGTWGLKMPNTSSFFMYSPAKSFIGKPLSYCYRPDSRFDVMLYVFNY